MITVSIPTIGSHKREQFAEAINSALAVDKSLISQVLIIDNSKDSDFSNFLKTFVGTDERVEYHFDEAKLNLAQNLNKGLDFCKNKWILFLCDDDGLYPESFSKVSEDLDLNLGYVSYDFKIKNENSDIEVLRKPGPYGILENTPKLVSTIFNVEKFKEIGAWNNDYGYFLDLMLYLMMEKNYECRYVRNTIGFHRQHADNASKKSYREIGYGKSIPRVIEKAFDVLEDPELQRNFLFHVCSYSYPHRSTKTRIANGIVRFLFGNNAWMKKS